MAWQEQQLVDHLHSLRRCVQDAKGGGAKVRPIAAWSTVASEKGPAEGHGQRSETDGLWDVEGGVWDMQGALFDTALGISTARMLQAEMQTQQVHKVALALRNM